MKSVIIKILFFIVVVAIFLPAFSNMQDKKAKNLEYEKQITQLEEMNGSLQEELKLLEENPEYLEKVAREKFGLIKRRRSCLPTNTRSQSTKITICRGVSRKVCLEADHGIA